MRMAGLESGAGRWPVSDLETGGDTDPQPAMRVDEDDGGDMCVSEDHSGVVSAIEKLAGCLKALLYLTKTALAWIGGMQCAEKQR